MDTNQKSRLQVFVDAMLEKDPYKRLALVRELRKMPKPEFSEEPIKARILKHKAVKHKAKPRISRHR